MNDEKMTTREWLPLIGLTVSAFLVNTSEFIPVGLLTDIAKSLGVAEAKAGILITGYSWTVTLLSLPLMLVFSRMKPRKLLLLTLFVFSLGQFLSVIAPGYAFLMIARICVASSHCIFWSIASPLAVRVVSRKHRSLALSAIVTGTSIAMVAGMPLGRLIGLQIGWRMTFMCVASVAVLTLVYLTAVFPDLSSGAAFSVKNMPELLRNRRLMLIYVICALWATAYYTGYGYIEPFLRRVANLPDGTVTIVLMLFGGAGLVGSMLFYRFYDFHRHAFLCSTLALISAALLLLRVSASGAATVTGVCIAWGIAVLAFNVSFQFEVISCVKTSAASVATAVFSSVINLGIGAGTLFGGIVCTNAGIGSIGYAGSFFSVAALIICFFFLSASVPGENAEY